MDSGTMILGLFVDTSVCRINPEGSRLEEMVREEELELISFLTSLQDFWAAANSSKVKKLMAFSSSNMSLDRASVIGCLYRAQSDFQRVKVISIQDELH